MLLVITVSLHPLRCQIYRLLKWQDSTLYAKPLICYRSGPTPQVPLWTKYQEPIYLYAATRANRNRILAAPKRPTSFAHPLGIHEMLRGKCRDSFPSQVKLRSTVRKSA